MSAIYRARRQRLQFQTLEPRNLLALLRGVVREDLAGTGDADVSAGGLAGITVYLDADNDGNWDPTEMTSVTRADDPTTPMDESGHYAFDVPAGKYVVRQGLNRPAPDDDELTSTQYLQTAPMRQPSLANSHASLLSQELNAFGLNHFTYEFTGVVETLMREALPPEWQSLQQGDEWTASIGIAWSPNEPSEFDPVMGAQRYHAINKYEFRWHSPTATRGVAEAAALLPAAASVALISDTNQVRLTVPLMAELGLSLVLDATLVDGREPNAPLRGGDIGESQSLRIVRGDGQTILTSSHPTLQWSGERADRLGQWVEMPLDQAKSIDFWNARDDDGDGLPNRWEEADGGLDIDGDGLFDLNLAARGADPKHKDLFVEVDAMDERGPLPFELGPLQLDGVIPTGTVLDQVIHAFVNAPVANPDGKDGIRLHIELDEVDLPRQAFENSAQPWQEFDAIAALHAGGSDQRTGDPNRDTLLRARQSVYRYAVFADTRAGGSSGLAEISGNNFYVTLGDWPVVRPDGTVMGGGTAEQQVGTFMHELGHTLGLRHGGDDDWNYKPNYLSVMNYHWQIPNANQGWKLDFSRVALPDLDPRHLNEQLGLGGGGDHIRRSVLVAPDALHRATLSEPVDWNRDGDASDLNVQSEFYRSYLHGSDGRGRAYDYYARDDAIFVPTLTGHEDWHFAPEDYFLPDDPEFGDGIHLCDNPEYSQESCYEDTTDFFTLSISPDGFEPDTESEPIALPFVDWVDWFDLDLLTGNSTGVFTLHNLDDHDSFVWPGMQTTAGTLFAKLSFDPAVPHPPELVIADNTHHVVGRSQIRGGTQTIEIDFADLPAGAELNFLVKRQGIAVDAESSTSLTVDPVEGLRYLLEIYAPRLVTKEGSRWDGDRTTEGQAGDGEHWTDSRNWSLNDMPDTPAGPDEVHVFPAEVSASVIHLAGDRTVEALQFAGTQTLCDLACGDTLTITSGVIDVYPDARASINAEVITAGVALTKQGQGTLSLDKVVASVDIQDGSLVGTPTIDGDLHVGVFGQLDPSGSVTIHGEWIFDGTVTLDLDDRANDQVAADAIRFGPSSVLIARATAVIAAADQEVRRTMVLGQVTAVAVTDQETLSEVRGVDRSDARTTNHAGSGVFVRSVLYTVDSIDLVLYQAGAGDTNGDGQFDSTDLILALQGGAYETTDDATWLHGDWNGDGRFDTSDLVVALQQGTYTVG